MSNESNTVEIEVRNAWGKTRIYPANETAQISAQIAGKKTLDKSDIDMIRALGFEVAQVFQKFAV